MNKRNLLSIFALFGSVSAFAHAETDTISSYYDLHEVVIKAPDVASQRVDNTELIGQNHLQRAACCSLGESFTTNPSVDVAQSDAATGARQIKLLGLGGTYVQMLTEHTPNLRGAAQPYRLNFIPGAWMQSIQVSKGASSVKNGYEGITGQINVELQKPQDTEGVRGNVYFDSHLKVDANADGNIHLNDRLSTGLLLHVENSSRKHDGDGDGFADMPKVKQYNLMHRWAYFSPKFISQLSLKFLHDDRNSGMIGHHRSDMSVPLYRISVQTDRYEGLWKNALMLNAEHNTSLALITSLSWHDAENRFGRTEYEVSQLSNHTQLMFETDFSEVHNLSVGASVVYDRYDEAFSFGKDPSAPSETTSGVYAQYTFRLHDKLTVMPGLRWDYSSVYGGFFTPRLHVRYSPSSIVTLRASAGKGYRTPHALAENTSLLASGRSFYFAEKMKQEEAWNYGFSAAFGVPVCDKKLEINVEYYYTDFIRQFIVNVDGAKGANTVSFENLSGDSYSHTFQADVSYPFFDNLTATAAFRYNDVKATYDGVLRRQPFTSRCKGLLTLSYKTPTEIWSFDVTGHINGAGERYDRTEYSSYFLLQAQVTREFRRFSVYVGGENLTNYKISRPVINASAPWSSGFDATQVWGPTDGAMVYVGLRFKFEKL